MLNIYISLPSALLSPLFFISAFCSVPPPTTIIPFYLPAIPGPLLLYTPSSTWVLSAHNCFIRFPICQYSLEHNLLSSLFASVPQKVSSSTTICLSFTVKTDAKNFFNFPASPFTPFHWLSVQTLIIRSTFGCHCTNYERVNQNIFSL